MRLQDRGTLPGRLRLRHAWALLLAWWLLAAAPALAADRSFVEHLTRHAAPRLHTFAHRAVVDVDAAVRRVREAGGTVVAEPSRQSYGVMAECTDDQGSRFYLGTDF